HHVRTPPTREPPPRRLPEKSVAGSRHDPSVPAAAQHPAHPGPVAPAWQPRRSNAARRPAPAPPDSPTSVAPRPSLAELGGFPLTFYFGRGGRCLLSACLCQLASEVVLLFGRFPEGNPSVICCPFAERAERYFLAALGTSLEAIPGFPARRLRKFARA